MDKTDLYRKPNTAMLESLFTQWDVKSKDECIMIGDASGKPGDFSDSDKKCAEKSYFKEFKSKILNNEIN